MTYHVLKILPEFFEAALAGIKPFEIRLNDRNFQTRDMIMLYEFDGENYTGRGIVGEIVYMTSYFQKEGYVVFSYKTVALLNIVDSFEVDEEEGILTMSNPYFEDGYAIYKLVGSDKVKALIKRNNVVVNNLSSRILTNPKLKSATKENIAKFDFYEELMQKGNKTSE